MAGRAEVVWDGDEVEGFQGARRIVRLQVDACRLRCGAFPLRGALLERSPTLDHTGAWPPS